MTEAFTGEIKISLVLKIGGSIAFGALLCYIGYSIISQNQREYLCFNNAKEWILTIEGNATALRDPKQSEFFAKQLATYNLACPKGHIMVRPESLNSVPLTVVKLSHEPRVVEAAKVALAGKP